MKLQLPPELLTKGLPPPDTCPLSSTEFVEPPPNKIPGYATVNHHAENAMWWGTQYVRIMKWSAVQLVHQWPYQPSAEQQMLTVCGTLATCPPLALKGWLSVDASSLCVVALPPDVTDCIVLQTGPDLLYHLPTPSLLCTENITSLGNAIYFQ